MSHPTQRVHPVAVLDTNVVTEMSSCADVLDLTKNGHPAPGTPEALKYAYRLTRMRDSLVLGWYLHMRRAATTSLSQESLRTLTNFDELPIAGQLHKGSA